MLQEQAKDERCNRDRFLRRGEDDLYLYGRSLYIPRTLRKALIKEAHDPAYSGHLGVAKTTIALRRRFWWPRLQATVHNYISKCGDCQRNKASTQKKQGELHPIPPPQRPFQQVTMDMVTGLPRTTKGNDSILVFVDRLTKTIRCVATRKKIGAEATARNVLRQHLQILWPT